MESVTVLKDHGTGENKGFGYVRYFKPLHAALAYENCDTCKYSSKFAFVIVIVCFHVLLCHSNVWLSNIIHLNHVHPSSMSIASKFCDFVYLFFLLKVPQGY